MINLPNIISFSRIPLAFCFLQTNPFYRTIALLIALVTDGLDGYLARRTGSASRLGTLLDPFTDKFFVILAASVLISEGRLTLFELSLLICRDFSVLLFGCYLLVRRRLSRYNFRAIWCGKITTVLQFSTLLAVIWGFPIPPLVYGAFVTLGLLAFVELACTLEPKTN